MDPDATAYPYPAQGFAFMCLTRAPDAPAYHHWPNIY
jgi:hypothetical protein